MDIFSPEILDSIITSKGGSRRLDKIRKTGMKILIAASLMWVGAVYKYDRRKVILKVDIMIQNNSNS